MCLGKEGLLPNCLNRCVCVRVPACMRTVQANVNCPACNIVGKSPDSTSGAHTFTCETWYSFLWVTNPTTEGIAYTKS